MVIGDILEVDSFEEAIHRDIANYICDEKFNIILYGNNVKYTKDALLLKGLDESEINLFSKEEKLYNYLDEVLKPEDVILLKASNGMKLYEIAEKLKGE